MNFKTIVPKGLVVSGAFDAKMWADAVSSSIKGQAFGKEMASSGMGNLTTPQQFDEVVKLATEVVSKQHA